MAKKAREESDLTAAEVDANSVALSVTKLSSDLKRNSVRAALAKDAADRIREIAEAADYARSFDGPMPVAPKPAGPCAKGSPLLRCNDGAALETCQRWPGCRPPLARALVWRSHAVAAWLVGLAPSFAPVRGFAPAFCRKADAVCKVPAARVVLVPSSYLDGKRPLAPHNKQPMPEWLQNSEGRSLAPSERHGNENRDAQSKHDRREARHNRSMKEAFPAQERPGVGVDKKSGAVVRQPRPRDTGYGEGDKLAPPKGSKSRAAAQAARVAEEVERLTRFAKRRVVVVVDPTVNVATPLPPK